jgi:anti-sigma factor RsiW
MMTEADLELLEMYLDDALSDRELAEVARRIADEPAVAAEVERLRAERDLRRQVFASLEPTGAAVDRLLGRVDESIRRRSGWEKQIKWVRFAAAAAACVVIGFTTGYLGRGPSSQPGTPIAQNPANNVAPTAPTQLATGNDNTQRDRITFVGKVPPAANATVQLTDDAGRVVAVQHFESADKAREFANDIRTWQERQRQVQSGNVQLMGGKF